MPPSKHSGSSRSAHKDSDQIPVGNMYVLGDYHFALERTSVPGSTNDKIEAICTKLNESKHARKSIQVPSSTEMLGWYVDANETEATVYCTIKKHDGEEGEATDELYPGVIVPISGSASYSSGEYMLSASGATFFNDRGNIYGCSTSPGTFNCQYYGYPGPTIHDGIRTMGHYVVNEKDVYLTDIDAVHDKVYSPPSVVGLQMPGILAFIALYGNVKPEGDGEITTVMVGRFAIGLEDAGGDGPGSDWIDPGDYDPDWEEGDPTHTLYVTVTGALSGRHNDPIVDPSYSYIPADKDTVKDYGCGGDGGHGGGGGAGASTVVIHKFATNQANSKEVTSIARRHGYGSGGGKGGKGGDGCILVYY